MPVHRLAPPIHYFLLAVVAGLACRTAASQDAVTHHVSAYAPVHSPLRELAADRPVGNVRSAFPAAVRDNTANTAWQVLATIPGAYVRDISFVTPSVGYAASENGQVWKTTDGGATWTEVLALGFPYEWEGVHALNTNDVLISGFNDQAATYSGIMRWSHDGGATWTGDIQISPTAWGGRPRFASPTQGMLLDNIQTAQFTTDGGAGLSDWTTVHANTDDTWFGDEFSLLSDLRTAASGIDYCTSSDAGATWSCAPSIDSVFDGETFFFDDDHGWVGSGEISPNVEGWLHRTTDGGKTWSGRVLNSPWPIREIFFVSPTVGWAAGGNLYTTVGGIYFSFDGGKTWALDADSSGHEMSACDSQPVGEGYQEGYQVWCAGFGTTGSIVMSAQGAATPLLSPAPGSFTGAQTVAMSTTTPNATIFYTTDGAAPSAASTAYSSPIAASGTTTIQAVAVAPGMAQSIAAAGTYTITPPQLQFSAASQAMIITAGSSGTVQLSVSATANAPNVGFSCSGLPAGAQCSFSPASLTATTQASTVKLTISASKSAALVRHSGMPLSLALLFPLLILPGAGLATGRNGKKLLAPWVLIMALSSLCGIAACGGPGSGQRSTGQPVQATVTVTAAAVRATSATTQILLTINP